MGLLFIINQSDYRIPFMRFFDQLEAGISFVEPSILIHASAVCAAVVKCHIGLNPAAWVRVRVGTIIL